MTESELAQVVKEGYENADFSRMFPLMEEDYEHISFWVLDVIRGKADAVEYYTNKAYWIGKTPGRAITGKLVRIFRAPDRVRPHGVYRDGIRVLEDPSFLHRQDAGKIAVLMKQYSDEDKKDIYTLAIPTVSENGLLKQVLIANPGFYQITDL